MERHAGRNPSKPALIADPFSESFGLAKIVEDLRELSEGSERIAKVEPEIDPLLDGLATLGEMRDGTERLLEPRDCFAIGRTGGSFRPGLTAVGDGLVPYLSPEGTVEGTWISPEGRATRYAPRSPDSTPVSTSVRTLSSKKNGLPPVRSTNTALSPAVVRSHPTRRSRRAWAFSDESGSSRSWP